MAAADLAAAALEPGLTEAVAFVEPERQAEDRLVVVPARFQVVAPTSKLAADGRLELAPLASAAS